MDSKGKGGFDTGREEIQEGLKDYASFGQALDL